MISSLLRANSATVPITCASSSGTSRTASVSPANLVSDIDIDVADIAGDLGVDIHDLIGLELSGEAQGVGDGASLNRHDVGGWYDLGAGGDGLRTIAVREPDGTRNQYRRDNGGNNEERRALSHTP